MRIVVLMGSQPLSLIRSVVLGSEGHLRSSVATLGKLQNGVGGALRHSLPRLELCQDAGNEKRHLQSRKRYLFRLSFWSSLQRPEQEDIRRFAGQSLQRAGLRRLVTKVWLQPIPTLAEIRRLALQPLLLHPSFRIDGFVPGPVVTLRQLGFVKLPTCNIGSGLSQSTLW
ncbi:unnamed protein product [Symbiodinium sp. CCMP2456]|nr:unnamed protein product [Symbiodinium sp. CCMP2456]